MVLEHIDDRAVEVWVLQWRGSEEKSTLDDGRAWKHGNSLPGLMTRNSPWQLSSADGHSLYDHAVDCMIIR